MNFNINTSRGRCTPERRRQCEQNSTNNNLREAGIVLRVLLLPLFDGNRDTLSFEPDWPILDFRTVRGQTFFAHRRLSIPGLDPIGSANYPDFPTGQSL